MGEVAGHEARHAACAGLLEVNVREVRADMPNDKCEGHVTFDHTGETWDRLRLAELMVVNLVDRLGGKNGPPAWPPDTTTPKPTNESSPCSPTSSTSPKRNGTDASTWRRRSPQTG
jgi:hypothetical protein